MQEPENISPDPETDPEEPETMFPPEEDFMSPDFTDSVSEEEPLTPVDEAKPLEKEETKTRKFFRKFVRWSVGLLIVFGLGFITAIFLLYNPTYNRLRQSETGLSSAEETASNLQDQISALESQVENLTQERDDLDSTRQSLEGQLQTANADLDAQQKAHEEALQALQDEFDLQITILTARQEVSKAQVALYDENTGLARIILTNIGESLTKIENLLPSDYQDAVQPLRDRLQTALGEIATAPDNAIGDLDILAGDLLELEDALFSE